MQSNKDNHLTQWLRDRGISDDVMSLFGIEAPFTHSQIGECIRIPYSDQHAKYRRDPLDDRKPKYLYDKGGKVTLYGADQLVAHYPPSPLLEKIAEVANAPAKVVITEGELDTLVLWSKNIPAVSSTGGAMSFQEDWAVQLAPYQVYLCFDNDDAGAEGMVRVLKYIPDAKIIFIPEQPGVKDVSDFVSRGGDFHALMATAKSYASVAEVEADKKARGASWLPTRFHDKYLDASRQVLYKSDFTPNKEQSDEVLRAKQYPMTDLLEFKGRSACCPWHTEKTPSLQYYPKNNNAYCFGSCGKRYDVIDLYMHQKGVDFMTAVTDLNEML